MAFARAAHVEVAEAERVNSRRRCGSAKHFSLSGSLKPNAERGPTATQKQNCHGITWRGLWLQPLIFSPQISQIHADSSSA